jgi:hypothetical protein
MKAGVNSNIKFSWKDKKNISIFASIVGGTAVVAICLYIQHMMFASDASLFELTNVFTFVIEIGIGIFISIMIFRYSRFEQNRSDNILSGIKGVHDSLENERSSRKETYQKSLISCFSDIWIKLTLIKLNLDHYGANEDRRNNPKVFENKPEVAEVLQMNKMQLIFDLQELNTLIVLLAPDMDSIMITTFLKFHKESGVNFSPYWERIFRYSSIAFLHSGVQKVIYSSLKPS